MLHYYDILEKKRSKKELDFLNKCVIMGIDPGDTTGVALIKNTKLVEKNQLPTGKGSEYEQQSKEISKYLNKHNPDIIVIEQYRIYGSKASAHIGQKLYTVELIGMVKLWGYQNKCYVFEEPAQLATNGFFTNKKMKAWGWDKDKGGHNANHWRDAFKHTLYYMLFNKDLDIAMKYLKKGE